MIELSFVLLAGAVLLTFLDFENLGMWHAPHYKKGITLFRYRVPERMRSGAAPAADVVEQALENPPYIPVLVHEFSPTLWGIRNGLHGVDAGLSIRKQWLVPGKHGFATVEFADDGAVDVVGRMSRELVIAAALVVGSLMLAAGASRGLWLLVPQLFLIPYLASGFLVDHDRFREAGDLIVDLANRDAGS